MIPNKDKIDLLTEAANCDKNSAKSWFFVGFQTALSWLDELIRALRLPESIIEINSSFEEAWEICKDAAKKTEEDSIDKTLN